MRKFLGQRIEKVRLWAKDFEILLSTSSLRSSGYRRPYSGVFKKRFIGASRA